MQVGAIRVRTINVQAVGVGTIVTMGDGAVDAIGTIRVIAVRVGTIRWSFPTVEPLGTVGSIGVGAVEAVGAIRVVAMGVGAMPVCVRAV